jgi:tetratricopeptide (TPR) repeat protein
MKYNIIKIAIGLIITLIYSSCTERLYTSLDVLRPAKIAFSPEVKRLLIVNNTVIQPANIGHKTSLLTENPKDVTINTDSLSLFCLGALTEGLKEKEFFSTVELNEKSTNSSNDFNITNSIQPESTKKLCERHHSEAILSLDKIKVNDQLSEYYIGENGIYLSNLELVYDSYWSIHYPNSSQIANIQFRDTAYWQSESYYRQQGLNGLPNRNDALVDGALEVGRKSVNRFIPYWDKVDRYFYSSSNKGMKRGIDSVYVKNWKGAIQEWEVAINKSKNNNTKAQLANNIAIAFELLGEIDKALEYANLSYNTLNQQVFVDNDILSNVTKYLVELTRRKREIEMLKQQLGE